VNTDLYLVIGLVLCALSIPSIMSAFADGRAPRVAAIVLLVGGVLTVVALSNKRGGYAIVDIPAAFVRVIATFAP